MKYINEINAFYNWQTTNPLSASAINLWHALMHVSNRAGWPKNFTVALARLQLLTGCSKSSVCRARLELKAQGRIHFASRAGQQAAVYTLLPFPLLYAGSSGMGVAALGDMHSDELEFEAQRALERGDLKAQQGANLDGWQSADWRAQQGLDLSGQAEMALSDLGGWLFDPAAEAAREAAQGAAFPRNAEPLLQASLVPHHKPSSESSVEPSAESSVESSREPSSESSRESSPEPNPESLLDTQAGTIIRAEQSKPDQDPFCDDADAASAEEPPTPKRLFVHHFSRLPSPAEQEACTQLLRLNNPELVAYAFYRACATGNPHLAYVVGVLSTLRQRAIQDMSDVAQDNLSREKKRRR